MSISLSYYKHLPSLHPHRIPPFDSLLSRQEELKIKKRRKSFGDVKGSIKSCLCVNMRVFHLLRDRELGGKQIFPAF